MKDATEWVDPYPVPQLTGARPPQNPPEPGRGRVWSNEIPAGSGEWFASWQDGDRQVAFEGTEAEVEAWCRSRPALAYYRENAMVADFVPWKVG